MALGGPWWTVATSAIVRVVTRAFWSIAGFSLISRASLSLFVALAHFEVSSAVKWLEELR